MKYLVDNLEVFIVDGEDDVVIRENNNTYDSIIQNKEDIPFFAFKKKKYYLNTLIPISLNTIKEKLEKNKPVFPYEIEQAAKLNPFKIMQQLDDETIISTVSMNDKNILIRKTPAKIEHKTDIIKEELLESTFEISSLGLLMLFRLGLVSII